MLESQRIVRLNRVCEITQLSRSTIYRLMAVGLFPARVALGTHSVGWRLVDIAEWLESREEIAGDQGRGGDEKPCS